jgi:uncharacterized membrane protein YoaK (UPF0700 family)
VTVSAPETQQSAEEMADRPNFRFVLVVGLLLALNAGFINAIGLLSLFNLAVSHVTGSVSNLGTAIARGDLVQVQILALVITSYFAGNVVSGFLVEHEELQRGHRYVSALLVEAIFIVAAIWLFNQERRLANYVLAAACGLQNGLATRYSGATVRTSHMTGIVTDLGILLGQRVRGKSISLWRVQLLSTLFAGFLGGGILAGFIFQSWGYQALWVSAIGTAVAGLSYSSFRPFAWLSRLGARDK